MFVKRAQISLLIPMILCKQNLNFIVLTSTRVVLSKDVCVFFAILISKSVSLAIQLVYFIRKLVILVILDPGIGRGLPLTPGIRGLSLTRDGRLRK